MAGEARIAPREFLRRPLLAVVGMSPQVLTETVYALAVACPAGDRFVPTEVEVVTTQLGAQVLAERLLARPGGAWPRLLADYGLGPIAFDASRIHVVEDAAGRPLADIRSAADNACLADTIAERVRLLTADPESALHVSLAGGRKTMGYYAGYALSLFGRPQDRLSHVLVPAEYEALPDFHYPTPRATWLQAQDGRPALDAARASVELADIPFVRLRSLLPKALLAQRSGFAAAVEAAHPTIAPPRLRLEVDGRRLVADGRTIDLTPTQFALYAALAHRARKGRPALRAPLRDEHDADWADETIADWRAAVGLMHVDSAVEASLRRDCAGNKISPHVSRLRTQLREQLAPGRDALYFDDGGAHRHKRYRVPLPPEAIEIVPAGAARKLAAGRAGAPRGHTRAPCPTNNRTATT
jgi:CRISPR-associated protein (TIGR02584 family)